MIRQGNYIDSGVGAYGAGAYGAGLQHASSEKVDHNSEFQDQLEAFTPEREQPYSNSQEEGQWRWERDGLKVSGSSMYIDGQGVDSSKSYYQAQMNPKVGMEKQRSDPRAQAHQDDMDLSYEDNRLSQTFEGLEQKFMDDITKLAKEQTEAEDAEISRHRGYQEQLAVLRIRHASRRDEVLRKESQARQQQFQQVVMMDEYHKSKVGRAEQMPDVSRPYGSDRYDSYGERSGLHGGRRDHTFEPRGQYPGDRIYDTGPHHY